MRIRLLASALLLVASCTSTQVVTPREYLDEKTAATITVVADPWIFNREGAPPQLDFVHLYAIDVNRMGDHRKYLVVVKYWPAPEIPGDVRPALEVRLPERQITLTAVDAEARELGIGQPIDESAPRSAESWFYPIDKANLEAIAHSHQFSVALSTEKVRAPYIVWRDGSKELSEFSAVALDY